MVRQAGGMRKMVGLAHMFQVSHNLRTNDEMLIMCVIIHLIQIHSPLLGYSTSLHSMHRVIV